MEKKIKKTIAYAILHTYEEIMKHTTMLLLSYKIGRVSLA